MSQLSLSILLHKLNKKNKIVVFVWFNFHLRNWGNMAISFQVIQEGPRCGVRWWLYPKCVSIGSSRRLSPSVLCRLPLPSCRQGPWVTVSVLHKLSLPRDSTFSLGFWPLIWLLMKAALCLPSCQAHFHGFGPFSFCFPYLMFFLKFSVLFMLNYSNCLC